MPITLKLDDRFNYKGKPYQIRDTHRDETTEKEYWLARNKSDYNDIVLVLKTDAELER